MTDLATPIVDPLADEPQAPTAEDHAMAAVDSALAPVLLKLRADAGPVHSSTLIHFAACVRQALAHVLYGAPDPVDNGGESLDMLGLQRRNGDAYRAYAEQCKADGVEPDDLPTFVANKTRDEDGAAAMKEDMEEAGFEDPDGNLTVAGAQLEAQERAGNLTGGNLTGLTGETLLS